MPFNTQARRYYDEEREKIWTRDALKKLIFSVVCTDENGDNTETFEHLLEICSTDSNGVLRAIPDEMTDPVLWYEILTNRIVTRSERDELLREKYYVFDMDEEKPESEIWDYFFFITEE